jgi:hypothetical protein
MIPTTIIFVPSKDGHSHCELEYTSPDALAHGTVNVHHFKNPAVWRCEIHSIAFILNVKQFFHRYGKQFFQCTVRSFFT